VGHSKDHAKGKVYTDKCPHSQNRDLANKHLMIHLKFLDKQEQTKSKTSRQREIIKIRANKNEIKPNKLYKESMKQKVGSLKRLTRLTNS
jgi:hypothetical protein